MKATGLPVAFLVVGQIGACDRGSRWVGSDDLYPPVHYEHSDRQFEALSPHLHYGREDNTLASER